MKFSVRVIVLSLFLALGAANLTMSAVGCAASTGSKRSVAELSQQGLATKRQVEAIKVVNDVTDLVIAANAAKVLSDSSTAKLLTVNKQVLDIMTLWPTDWKSRVLVVIQNAQQGLPPELAAQVPPVLNRLLNGLQGVQ